MRSLNISGATTPESPSVPMKQLAFSLFLLCCGCFFLIVGIHVPSSPMVIMGILAFTPGAYSMVVIIQTLRGTPGYSFEQLPSYEPEQ
mmetsp:Transcript_26011/g.51888  ORF Transcript_26011/g.51888 Transcript_26011/m.51888 type:complete len:88 (+) Transcript_26011:216-479(+)